MRRKDLIKYILEKLEVARVNNHRIMVVFTGESYDKSLKIVALLMKQLAKHASSRINLLYVYHAFYEDSVLRRDTFSSLLSKSKRVAIHYVSYHEAGKVLGLTFDHSILDLYNNLEPNDIGKLIGVTKGGGLIILLTPDFDHWLNITTRFQQTLTTHKYTTAHLRRIFVRRFINKLFQHDGIMIYNVDKNKMLKELKIEKRAFKKKELKFPQKAIFPYKVYSMALTQDQVEVIHLLEKLYEKPEKKVAVVITADRGRGKSCAVGIALAALAHKLRRAKGRSKIIVTAPNESNVQPLFGLLIRTLEELNYNVNIDTREDYIVSVKCKGIDIKYYSPIDAIRTAGDIIAVDEAASLQVPMLYLIHRKFNRAIFSSTIHGYEGAGRGFSVRFLSTIKKDVDTIVIEYDMEEPIRYAINDPIEAWLFDTLLLDAEPLTLSEDDLKDIEAGNYQYIKPEYENFFLKQEDKLRQFIGIYIMAHYRNNPNDLGMMMDAPHHDVRYIELPSGKIIASIELAEEGDIDEGLARELAKGAWIAGNIIPDRYIKHYKVLSFGKRIGWRIVRIAVHPSATDMGIGSKALSFIEEEAKARDYDWVGAGFGVNRILLNFWLKNGYIPIHISPDRNPVSGEYTVIVLKHLKEDVKRYIIFANREFRRKLLNSLHEPYHDLDPEVALMLLDVPYTDEPIEKLELSDAQIGRLLSYSWSTMTVENCMDAVTKLVKHYFSDTSPDKPQLSKMQKLLLIVRILQAKSWRYTCEDLGLSPAQAMSLLRETVRILTSYYLGVKSKEEAESFAIEV